MIHREGNGSVSRVGFGYGDNRKGLCRRFGPYILLRSINNLLCWLFGRIRSVCVCVFFFPFDFRLFFFTFVFAFVFSPLTMVLLFRAE